MESVWYKLRVQILAAIDWEAAQCEAFYQVWCNFETWFTPVELSFGLLLEEGMGGDEPGLLVDGANFFYTNF